MSLPKAALCRIESPGGPSSKDAWNEATSVGQRKRMLVREKSISAGSRGAQSRELLRGGESRLSSGSGRGERGAASRRERERHFAPRRAPGGAEAPTGGFPLVRGEGGEWRARGRLGGSPPFDRQVSPRLERLGFVLSSSGRATEIKQVQNMWSFIGTTTTGSSLVHCKPHQQRAVQ